MSRKSYFQCRVLGSSTCLANGQKKPWWPEKPSDKELQSLAMGSRWCQGGGWRGGGKNGAPGLFAFKAFALSAMFSHQPGAQTCGLEPIPLPALHQFLLKSPAVRKTSRSLKSLRSSPEDSSLGCFCSVCFCVMGSE